MNKVQQEIITLPMTSNNSSGQVVSASYTLNSLYSIYNEGGRTGASATRIISGSKIGHTTIQLSEPLVANKVILRFGKPYLSKNFQIQGSNDGVNFDDLFTVENNAETELSLTFDNDKEYVYYRFYSTDAPFNFIDFYQINYYKTYTVYTSKILLLKENGKASKVDTETNSIVDIPSQTEQDFLNYGLNQSELTEIDFSSGFTEKHYIQNQSTPLGSGKIFEQPLDLDKVTKSVKIT